MPPKMSPWDRHVAFLKEYQESKERGTKSDAMSLREAYEFVSSGNNTSGDVWGRKLAEAYCKRLYKEYALVDLSHYKKGKIGMRWRTESEVVSGKGQFQCAGIQCSTKHSLITLEVPFRYIEHKQKKEALVKVRLCSHCNHKMQYHHLVKKNRLLGLEPPPDTLPDDVKQEPIPVKDEYEGPKRPSEKGDTAAVKRPKIEPEDVKEEKEKEEKEGMEVKEEKEEEEVVKEKEVKEEKQEQPTHNGVTEPEAPPPPAEVAIDREAERLAWAPQQPATVPSPTDEFDDFLAEMFP